MKSLLLYLICVVCIITSCGPSAEEKLQMLKQHDDSIKLATEEETKLKIDEDKRIADSIENEKRAKEQLASDKESLEKILKNNIADKKTEIRLSNETLSKIKEYQLMRTPAEKQHQIEAQYKKIQRLEQDYEMLNDDLKSLKNNEGIDGLRSKYLLENGNFKEADRVAKATADSIASAAANAVRAVGK